MSGGRTWLARLGGLFGKERRDRELDAEMASHLAMHIEDNVRAGMTPEEARRQAVLKLGGIEQTKESYRERRGIPWIETLLRDIRFGLRMLRKNPGFTAVAVVTLALGIGANATIFSMVNGFLLRPLPVLHPEQIAALAVQQKDVPLGALGFSYPEFVDFRGTADAFSEVFANVLSTVALSADDRTDQLPVCYVSANFFSALGLKPAFGRLIQPSDGEAFGQPSLVVLGYAFWQKRFGGDAGIVGRQVRINGRGATVIGVASKEFRGMFSPFEIDAYLPVGAILTEEGESQFTLARGSGRVLAFGRLRPGVSLAEAQNSLDVIASRLALQYPATDAGIRVRAIPEKLARPQPYANDVFIVIGGLFLVFAGLVLLLACTNVANVVLARALVRRREMAVRAALGASRGRLISQMLTETLLLAVLGGASGLALAEVANRLAPSVHFPGFPLRLDFTFDWRVYAYALAAAVFAGVASGLPSALRASRADVNSMLRDDGLSSGAGEKHHLHSDLVIAQIACSLTLLVTAGLFVRSLRHIEGTYLGFDPDHILNVVIDPPEEGYDRTLTVEFYRELYERVRALPGVRSASLAASVPMGSFPARTSIFRDSQPTPPNQQPSAILYNRIDPGYLQTMQVALLRGRDFTETDGETAPPVAIVNETMARRFYSGKDPIGESFRMGSAAGRVVEIIGIARDGKYQTVAEDFQPYFYVPLAQNYISRRVLEIRSRVPPELLATQVQREIHSIAPGVSIVDLRTMKQSLEGGTGYFAFRLGAFLAVQMGFVGLILAVVGVYGVASFAVTQRTHEIGVRMALGANSRDLLVLVLRRGVGLIIAGLAVGLIASWALSRTISHVLAGVSATDPLIYAAATVTLSFVALIACWVPARRTIYASGGLVLLVVATAALARLKPAAPAVDRATVWTDTVKRGPMLRDVRGLGTLEPETIWVIPAVTDGRVEKRFVLPGTPVRENTVILVLGNPQLQQMALDAGYQLKGAQASYEQTKAQLQNQLMDKRTQAASVSSQYRTAEMTKESYERLGKLGLKADLDVKTAEVQAEELAKQNDLAQQEVAIFKDSIDAQLAVQQANVDQKRELYKLKESQVEQLQVRAGVDGILQELNVDIGQRVAEGAPLAKVSQPTELKAALQIAETQAKDIAIGQKASIDTHNGVIPGHVMRIDPSVVNGTRTVDVKLDGALPRGAVPSLSVEGTIEIERLADVLYVGRPVHGDADSTVGLFKLVEGGKEAVRVPVELGRTSVNSVEIRKGLKVGDQVILSDMSASDNFDRVELK